LKDQHASPGSRHKTLVLEEGLTWQPISVNHEDAQFLETKRFSAEEIARLFLVPPHMIGAEIKGSMTYTNAETRGSTSPSSRHSSAGKCTSNTCPTRS
jgi:phage portal protein BeeE